MFISFPCGKRAVERIQAVPPLRIARCAVLCRPIVPGLFFHCRILQHPGEVRLIEELYRLLPAGAGEIGKVDQVPHRSKARIRQLPAADEAVGNAVLSCIGEDAEFSLYGRPLSFAGFPAAALFLRCLRAHGERDRLSCSGEFTVQELYRRLRGDHEPIGHTSLRSVDRKGTLVVSTRLQHAADRIRREREGALPDMKFLSVHSLLLPALQHAPFPFLCLLILLVCIVRGEKLQAADGYYIIAEKVPGT